MALLSCQDLSLGYEGKPILEHINFEVNTGDYLCIVGENGSGKSTLMKTILGLIHPLMGKVQTGDGLRQNEIGYLPQQTVVQRDFPASVYEIVLSGCQGRQGFRPFNSKEDKALAWENIRRMEIEPLAKRCYRELSGGQQQDGAENGHRHHQEHIVAQPQHGGHRHGAEGHVAQTVADEGKAPQHQGHPQQGGAEGYQHAHQQGVLHKGQLQIIPKRHCLYPPRSR